MGHVWRPIEDLPEQWESLGREGIRADLMQRGATDGDPDVVALLIHDALDTIDGVSAFVRQERPLSTCYVKELRRALLRCQVGSRALDPRGEWRSVPTRVGTRDGALHEYCPLEYIAAKTERLAELRDRIGRL